MEVKKVIRRGSIVLPKGTTDKRIKRKQLVDAIAKRHLAKKAGHEASVFIAKARNAKVKKDIFTGLAKEHNADANALKKASKGRKISLAAGGANIYIDGRTNPMTIKSYARKSKYSTAQLRQIPSLDKKAARAASLSKKFARVSGGTATGIKRTAEAAINRIATGKALKGMARAGGALSIAGMFTQHLAQSINKGKKNG
jgi:hypothetical protein